MISRLAKGALLGAAAGIVGSAASLTPFGLDLEQNHGLGILFRLRGQRTPPQDVVVVSIDKESADNLDLDDDVKNWPRSLHARLTENLAEKGASVIAFDVFFEEPTERGEDLAFAEAMRKANNVLLGERQQSEKLVLTGMKGKPGGEIEIARRIPPVPLLADASVATTPFPLPKVPIKVNWGWTFRKTAEDAPTPTLPVVAFQMYSLSAYGDFLGLLEKVFPEQAKGLPRSGEEVAGSRGVVGMIREVREIFESAPSAKERMLHMLDSSPSNPADPERRRILRSLIHLYGGGIRKFLNFYGPIQTIPTIPYYRALKIGGKGKGDPSPAEVAGKAVFIGSSESRQLAQKDGFYTVYTTENGVDLSGVEIQATVFANLVEDMPVRPLPFRFHVATLFLWGLGVGILSIIFRPAVSIPAVTALSLMYLGAAEYRFAAACDWYPIVFPLAFQAPLVLLCAVAWNFVDVSRERRNFRRGLEAYLPVHVVDELEKNIADLKVSNRVVDGVCLATDAERYTSLSEGMESEELAAFMNKYYAAVFDPVKLHGGMVSNVVGDSMLALWLTTKENPPSFSSACLAAIEIDHALAEFNRSRPRLELPTRIGLHYGNILLGNIGAAYHYEYRPIGDIVNTATRIEGLNKQLGTQILVSEEVVSQANKFLARDLGKFLLVGKSKPVHVYELVSRQVDSSPRQRDYCAVFAEGLESFRRQAWADASAKFHETLKIRDGDGPSLFYARLCSRYAQNPPGISWDGVVRMENK